MKIKFRYVKRFNGEKNNPSFDTVLQYCNPEAIGFDRDWHDMPSKENAVWENTTEEAKYNNAQERAYAKEPR